MGVDTGCDADQDPLPRRCLRREPGDLRGGVDHDTPDAVAERRMQICRRLRVPVQDDPARRKADRAGDRQLSSRADVQRQPLLPDPAGHRAAQERLARIRDLRIGERRGVGAAPGSDVCLVEDVGGRAVGRRQRAQAHPADADLTVRLETSRAWPDVFVQRWRAGYTSRSRRSVTSSAAGWSGPLSPSTSCNTRAASRTRTIACTEIGRGEEAPSAGQSVARTRSETACLCSPCVTAAESSHTDGGVSGY